MKILGALSISFLLSISFCHAELSGIDYEVIEMAYTLTDGKVVYARELMDEKIILGEAMNRSVIQKSIEDLVRRGHSIRDVYPLGFSVTSDTSKLVGDRVLTPYGSLVGLVKTREVRVHLLVADSAGGFSGSERINSVRVKILDHDTYVTSFDYHSRLAGSPLSNLIRPDGIDTKIVPVSEMEPKLAANFIRMKKSLKTYEQTHPGVKYRLVLELRLREGKTIDVPLTSDTSATYSALSPGLFGGWSKTYRAAEKLAKGDASCGESVAAAAQ